MTHDSARSLREELPAHGAWVRKLARSLVQDEASADDLAQETALAALRGEHSRRGALAPWLARVARNFAHRGWRDATRRRERERAAAREERQPGADEAAERLEIQRLLVEELAALEPDLRLVLVRRYFDGWSAARIARATGEPASTVRWRLQRGLAELRARLDRDGDGTRWRLALLPPLGAQAPWAALRRTLRPLSGAGAIQGALTMKATSQVLAAGAFLAALGVGMWWNATREEGPQATPRGEPELRQEDLLASQRIESAPAPALPPARERLPVEKTTAPAPPPATPESETLRIEGRCVDERLVPIRGVRLGEASSKGQHTTESRSDGRFTLAEEPRAWASFTLTLEAEGFATRFLPITLAVKGVTELGDVILAPGGGVSGRVVDARSRPFAGATVTITSPHLWRSLEEERAGGPSEDNALGSVSRADGSFEVTGVGVGPVRAWAGASGMRWAISPPVEVRAHERSQEVVLVLEPQGTDELISGVVLSPDGEPVPDASIEGYERVGGGMSSLFLTADAEGRFELVAKPGHVYDLEASDPEGRWSKVEEPGIEPGTLDLELRFLPARWIDLHVQRRDGKPIEDYLVATDGEEERGDPLFHRVTGDRHEGGDERLLVPGHLFYVRVDARGFAPGELGPFQPGSVAAALTLELDEEPGLRGRVLAEGRPLAGARVLLHEADPRMRIDHQGYPALCSPHVSDETTTDAEGRFLLRVRQTSSWIVRAEATGHAPADVGPLELAPGTPYDELELVLGQGGVLEGHVLLAPGRETAGVIVIVNRGDARPRSVRTDAEGSFRFEGLTAGPWHLSRGQGDVNPQGGGTAFSRASTPTVIPFNCTVREGQTTYQDLDLRDWEPCELTGLLLVNGAPAANWGVMAWPGDREAMMGTPPSSATGADGRFALTIEESGPVRLSFSPSAELGGSGRIDARTELHPGPNEWHDDIAMGSLRGRCRTQPAADSVLFFNAAAGAEHPCWLQIRTEADGSFTLPFVPAGKGSIRVLSGEGSWTTLVETEIHAGAAQTVDVP